MILGSAGPCVPWSLGFTGFPLICMVSVWVFDSLGMLHEFVRQVVISRRNSGLRSWANWPREDSGSGFMLGFGQTSSPLLPRH